MEFREIQSFLVLAKTQSILETARLLHLTPGAVHKHLKTLQSNLGVRLYEKRAGALQLTAAGETALPHFQEVLDSRDAAVRAISDWEDDAAGVVRIGAGPSFSTCMLPGILSRFRRRYPKVEIFIETGDGRHLMESMRNGSLDLIFDVAYPTTEPSDATLLAMWESRVGIVSAMPSLSPHCPMGQLAKLPFILFRKGSAMQDMIDAYFEHIDFHPRVVMRSDSAEAIKAMVRARLGVAMLFLWNANQELRSHSLQVIRPNTEPLAARIVLLKRRSRYTPRIFFAFAEVAQRSNWANLHPLSTGRHAPNGPAAES